MLFMGRDTNLVKAQPSLGRVSTTNGYGRALLKGLVRRLPHKHQPKRKPDEHLGSGPAAAGSRLARAGPGAGRDRVPAIRCSRSRACLSIE